MRLVVWMVAVLATLFTDLPRFAWARLNRQAVAPLRRALQGSDQNPPHDAVIWGNRISIIGVLSALGAVVGMILVFRAVAVFAGPFAYHGVVLVGTVLLLTYGLVVINLKEMRSNGKTFGLDISTGDYINFTMGALAEYHSE